MNWIFSKISQLLHKRFPGFSSEHEQALSRDIIALLAFIYLSFHFFTAKIPSDILPFFVFSGAFFIASILLTISIFSSKPSKTRQAVAMISDVCAITYGMYMNGEIGTLFYGIYLWIIVGNGLRYGSKALFRTQLLSVLGFVSVIFFSDYWPNHKTLASGLLFTMLAIPLLTFSLLERLKRAVARAEEANKAKSFFIANISHEIRTPLNGIIGANDLILDTQLNSEQQELVNTMHNSGRSLLKLIENVLDFSKIESGKLTAEIIDFDLHELINNSADIFSVQTEKKGLRLHIRVTPDTAFLLRGDAQHLRQVIINLLGNAIKFTNEGKVELRVTTLNQNETSTRLRFEVIDTGIGIPESAQHTIFESFKQAHTDTIESYGGTGLGTTISKQLVEFMGGTIGLHSIVNQGTTFWFELPFDKPPEKRSPEKRQTLRHMCVLGTGMSAREQSNVATCMSGWGGRFRHAESIDQLLSLLEQIPSEEQRNHIVLCSPQGLSLTAKELVTRIGSAHTSGKVSLIMLDADPSRTSEADLMAMGYDGSLSMPIDKSLLFNTVHRVMSANAESNDVISFMKHYERSNVTQQKINILVADDNGTNRIILAKILERAGHNVNMVENGEQALDILDGHRYDLAIMDMHMPVLGGLEAFKIYRATNRERPNMPIIILTASATVEARRMCEEAGVDAFLTKPIETYSLLETIKRLTLGPGKPTDVSQPANTQPAAEKHIDATVLNEHTVHQLKLLGDGSNEFLDAVVKGFLLEGRQLLESMNTALLKREYMSFRESAHALKGSSGNIGAEALFKVCREISQLNLSELRESAHNRMNAAQKAFDSTRLMLMIYLKTPQHEIEKVSHE
jgi:two-component system, sensor histidine kinase RpfC